MQLGPDILIRAPKITDGVQMWRVARDTGVLDLNSSYAYALFARDFAATCRVAVWDGVVVGFVTGYRRPADPDCLFVWQIGVDARCRGMGVAARLLDDLIRSGPVDAPIRAVQTTITDDNTASQSLFRSFARRWGSAPVTVHSLFDSAHLVPAGEDGPPHAPERLYEIGPPGGH